MISSIQILMGRMRIKIGITRSKIQQGNGRDHDETCTALRTAREKWNKAKDMRLCAHASTT